MIWLVLLFVLGMGHPSFAQTQALEQAREGKITLPAGEIYVPINMVWSEEKSTEGKILVGHRATPPLKIGIAFLPEFHTIDNTIAVKLFEEHLLPRLDKEAKTVKLKETLGAPYPWPDSLELRLDRKEPVSVYVGSGSGSTLLVASYGEGGPEVANAIAASFKENFAFRLENREKDGKSKQIQSMLSASSSFILVIFLFLPMAYAAIQNRRQSVQKNPFQLALVGLGVGFVCSLLVNVALLSRFPWATAWDYGASFGSSLVRYLFLLAVAIYFSKRWRPSIEPAE